MKEKFLLIFVAFFLTLDAYAQSEIIVKRASSSINAGFREQIYIDGLSKLNLVNGMEGKINISDGEHVIFAKLSSLTSNEVRFNIRSGLITFSVTPLSPYQLVIEQQSNNKNSAAIPAAPANGNSGVENSLERAAEHIIGKIAAQSKIAIVYVTAEDSDAAEYIADELEFILVNRSFTVIDRSQLDQLRKEQNFQLSGEVDDDHVVSIGKIVGASVIITGAVTGTGNLRRLRIRALDTQTGQVLSVASERF